MLKKKSFNLFSRYNYDKNNKFTYKFNGKTCEGISLKSGSTSAWLMTDSMNSYVAKEIGMNFDVQDFTGSYLYLNGEFWGYYFIADKMDDRYIEEKYGIEDAMIFKSGEVENGYKTDQTLYNNFALSSLEDFAVLENYQKFENSIVIEQLVDYLLYQYYVANDDWNLFGNIEVWRSRDVGKAQYEDGKFRMILFDTDHGSGVVHSADTDSTTLGTQTYKFNLISNLIKVDSIKQLFNERAEYLFEKMNPSNIISIIENRFEENKLQTAQDYFRFNNKSGSSLVDTNYAKYIQFIQNRIGYMKTQLSEKYGLIFK